MSLALPPQEARDAGEAERIPTSASQRRADLAAVLQDAARHPWRHGFLPLLRRIAATHDALPPPGLARRPSQEAYRLGQQASLAFAPRELAGVAQHRGRAEIRLFGLGLLGPGGALPLHYTETLHERAQTRRDTAGADFIDLFHHRALSHFYRAWAQAQAAAGLDRPQAETFTRYVAWLAGDEAGEVPAEPLPRHARWASAAHRVRRARNPEGLVRTLVHYFGVRVTLREYVLRWIDVAAPDRCQLGRAHPASTLGGGAMAGAMVPDRQAQFRLVIGPLNLQQYLRFMPGTGHDAERGRDLRTLVEWVRAFVGFEYAWDTELHLLHDEVPPARLGGTERLGWSTWLADGRAVAGQARRGMVLEPEAYVRTSS
ncbi:MAG: type VI secretion system baseplate subunit TssG [Burkholderiales bacterium]|nr:type VI secretion system baseplate subunit TssG [Burkholderiales bacterium]